jgi:adenylate cyclase
VRERFVAQGEVLADRTLAAPGLPDGQSRLAVPAMAFGQLIGVLVVDSARPVAFGSVDEQLLAIVAGALAAAIEHDRAVDQAAAEAERSGPPGADRPPPHVESAGTAVESTSNRPPYVAPELGVRFFGVDGSVFFGNDYVIKGVAGRILWSMLQHHVASGRTEFTNRELRLDPSLELPGFKDNLESRLILLRRRLDEHDAPVRLHRTGRGRLQLHVERPLRLEAAG